MSAIKVENISKSFGKVKALDGISFNVERGELFGLIGPDGAGKTTLFRLLTTLLNPDNGRAEVDGFDIVKDYQAIRERVGYMPGRFSLYQDLTVEENLNFFAALFGVKVEDSYDLVAPIYRQIEPFKKRKAGKLSGGMKQRVSLARAFLRNTPVLILDEATKELDYNLRKTVLNIIKEQSEHRLVIMITHDENDITELSADVLMLKPNDRHDAFGNRRDNLLNIRPIK